MVWYGMVWYGMVWYGMAASTASAGTRTDFSADLKPNQVQELKCLGSYLAPRGSTRDSDAQALGGTDAALQDVTNRVGKEATALVDLTSHGLSKQTAASLLRYLLVGAPQHILRTGILSADKIAAYDAVCKRAWGQLAQANMTTDMWRQAQWPLAAGGLATGSIEHRHLAAFVAGTHESVPHVAGRLGYVTTQEYLTARQEVKTPLQTATAQVNRLAPKLPHQSWAYPAPANGTATQIHTRNARLGPSQLPTERH